MLSSFTIFGSALVSAIETDDAPTDEAEPPPQETVAGVSNPLSEAVRKPEDDAIDAGARVMIDLQAKQVPIALVAVRAMTSFTAWMLTAPMTAQWTRKAPPLMG